MIVQAYATPTIQTLLFASAAISPATGVPWLEEISTFLFEFQTHQNQNKNRPQSFNTLKAWLPFRGVQRSGKISVVKTIKKVLKKEWRHSNVLYNYNLIAVDWKYSEWFWYYTY